MNELMNLLALDLGTKTGWAMLQAFAVTSGSVSFATNRLAGYGIRFLNFRNWLIDMFTQHDVDLVVFEDVKNHIGVYAAHAYGGFMAQLASVCEEQKILYQGYGVKTIKKFITGNGNANKQMVIEAIRAKGYKPVDDNEADAIALLLLAESDLVKKGSEMNNISNGQYRCDYKNSIRSAAREVKNRIIKYNDIDSKIFMGPCKYSQVTGRITAGFRYRQTFLHS